MRTLTSFLAILLLAAIGVRPAAAQEIGQNVSITGCLAQEDEDGETDFILESDELGEEVEEIELIAGEGVNLAPHVGHTVEATGVVVEDDDEDEAEEEEEEEEEEEDDDANEVHIRVTELGHVAASCEGGRR